MNVFEDLVVELQRENLLESTVIETDLLQNGHSRTERAVEPADEPQAETIVESDEHKADDAAASKESDDEDEKDEMVVDSPVDEEAVAAQPDETTPTGKKPKNDSAFFKKRAVDEVASLQMVEHVLTGVEREYLKIVPKSFEDFNAKRALHTFLQIADDVKSEAHAKAEFALMQETESWCSALAERDRNIPVAYVRQYVENSRPALSSQAMLAIARFYRNLPYSESVRGKFDFVITRLFSRPDHPEMRQLLFRRDEMLDHLKTLYADWSSISLYSANEDDSNETLTALSFEELSGEAEISSCFDELLKNDFFGRLRLFKESIAELFFAPVVTCAAIECNIRVGNAYVNLIEQVREKMDEESIQAKYAELNDQDVSNATSRTLDLAELLRLKSEYKVPDPAVIDDSNADKYDVISDESAPKQRVVTEPAKQRSPIVERMIGNVSSINRGFLAVAILLIAASIGLYVWANYFVTDSVSSAGVRNVEIESTILKDHIKTARVSGEILYGLLQPSWDVLPKEKRLEYLQKVYQAGHELGYTQVNLIGTDGKMAAYASPTRMEVIMP